MKSKRFLITFAFSGENFQGVTHIPADTQSRTIQKIFESKLHSFFLNQIIKTKFASRLDKGVSALKSYCMLIFNQSMDRELIVGAFNEIDKDILILGIECIDEKAIMLNLVQHKKYTYFFTFGTGKNNESDREPLPWTHYREEFDLELMNRCLNKMVGDHDFINFIGKKSKLDIARMQTTRRHIDSIELKWQNYPEILLNRQRDRTPQSAWGLSFTGTSFMRGQIRLMVGALFKVSSRQMTIDKFDQLLLGPVDDEAKWLVPAKGLVLVDTQLKD
jgi:tRNA pseudouridine38-40 synthase